MAWVVAVVVGNAAITVGRPWYDTLEKPVQPPGWLSNALLPVLLCLAASACVATVNSTLADRRIRTQLALVLAGNGVLNVLWTWLFFRCQRPDWALVELPLFWLSAAGMIWVASRANRPAAWLLAPYLAWVTFLGGVNLAVVFLN